MIQRDGLLNYWAYASGHQPVYAHQHGSPPLMRRSLASRPPYPRYGEGWSSASSSHFSYQPGYATNRYQGASIPTVSHSAPRTSQGGSSSSKRSSSKPKTSSSSSHAHSPRVKKPVEEPDVSPPSTPSPSSPNPSPSVVQNNSPATQTAKPNDLPFGSAVSGRPNMVNSPYADKSQLVDVAGMAPGQTVKCPYSGKLFKVPPTQQAANKAESKLEPKDDKPAGKSEAPEKP